MLPPAVIVPWLAPVPVKDKLPPLDAVKEVRVMLPPLSPPPVEPLVRVIPPPTTGTFPLTEAPVVKVIDPPVFCVPPFAEIPVVSTKFPPTLGEPEELVSMVEITTPPPDLDSSPRLI